MDSGLEQFKVEVFDHVKGAVTRAVLAQINNEREGEAIDRDHLKKCIFVYEKMGEGNLEVYQADFEAALLDGTREYYERKAAAWIATDNVPTYLVKVEKVLESEANRVQSFMNDTTEPNLLKVVEDVLLARQQDKLLQNEGSGLRALLREEKHDDLGRMYRLYNRLGERGLDPIAKMVRDHFQDMGLGVVKDRESQAAAAAGGGGAGAGAGSGAKAEKESAENPAFVLALLDLHDKAKGFVASEFQGHTRFQKALKDAFDVFVNKEVESSRFSNAEMIASYCDRVLKSGGDKLSEDQIEEALERVVQIFFYIADKDVFADIYRSQLSKRILNQRSVSNDSERSFIGKLKLRTGAQFTSKMEGMLNDLATASEQASEFKTWSAGKPEVAATGIDFSVQVLTMAWWPSFAKVDAALPHNMLACQEIFQKYYTATKQHRRLQWLHSAGTATVKATFGGKNVYELSVVTIQAVALLLFNDTTGPLGLEAVRERMGSELEVVKKTLHSLSCGKYKVLTKTPESSTIAPTDTFDFNAGFTSNLRRIRIPMASLEEGHNPKRVEDDRSNAIEACVVRVMKSRKTLGHQQLVAEVIAQLHFFKPNPKVIKKRIENLIDREFLERDSTDNNVYNYLA
jgi:cullin 1